MFHDGLVKRPADVDELDSFGAKATAGAETTVTGLENDRLAVPETEMNKHFKAWRRALAAWNTAGQIHFERLAKGYTTAFDFLADENITWRCSDRSRPPSET